MTRARRITSCVFYTAEVNASSIIRNGIRRLSAMTPESMPALLLLQDFANLDVARKHQRLSLATSTHVHLSNHQIPPNSSFTQSCHRSKAPTSPPHQPINNKNMRSSVIFAVVASALVFSVAALPAASPVAAAAPAANSDIVSTLGSAVDSILGSAVGDGSGDGDGDSASANGSGDGSGGSCLRT